MGKKVEKEREELQSSNRKRNKNTDCKEGNNDGKWDNRNKRNGIRNEIQSDSK